MVVFLAPISRDAPSSASLIEELTESVDADTWARLVSPAFHVFRGGRSEEILRVLRSAPDFGDLIATALAIGSPQWVNVRASHLAIVAELLDAAEHQIESTFGWAPNGPIPVMKKAVAAGRRTGSLWVGELALEVAK